MAGGRIHGDCRRCGLVILGAEFGIWVFTLEILTAGWAGVARLMENFVISLT